MAMDTVFVTLSFLIQTNDIMNAILEGYPKSKKELLVNQLAIIIIIIVTGLNVSYTPIIGRDRC